MASVRERAAILGCVLEVRRGAERSGAEVYAGSGANETDAGVPQGTLMSSFHDPFELEVEAAGKLEAYRKVRALEAMRHSGDWEIGMDLAYEKIMGRKPPSPANLLCTAYEARRAKMPPPPKEPRGSRRQKKHRGKNKPTVKDAPKAQLPPEWELGSADVPDGSERLAAADEPDGWSENDDEERDEDFGNDAPEDEEAALRASGTFRGDALFAYNYHNYKLEDLPTGVRRSAIGLWAKGIEDEKFFQFIVKEVRDSEKELRAQKSLADDGRLLATLGRFEEATLRAYKEARGKLNRGISQIDKEMENATRS